MFTKYKEIEGIRVGRARTKPATPTHVPGTRRGNARGNYEDSRGHLPDGRSTARRSTGIDPEHRNPILPEMPNLSPG
jgi:hypothetical protein